jgi:predicted O-methyltransferase YrrM
MTVFALALCFALVPPVFSADGAAQREGKYKFSSDWFSYNIPNWTRVLSGLKGKPNVAYLEIGVYEGRSFFWVVDNILTHPSSRAVAIDTFDKFGGGDPEEVFYENVRRSGRSPAIKVIKGFSQQKLRDLALNSFDLIYVDGDHSSRSVLLDAVLSWDLLRDGGIMIFDDYAWDFILPTEMRPTFALDMFQTLFRDEFQVLVKDYQLIIRKAKAHCNEARGSIKVADLTLACSRLGSYVYYWKPKKLYDASTDREVALSNEEASLIEGILVGRKFGFRLEVEKKEADQYRSLLDRLGIDELNLSVKAK